MEPTRILNGQWVLVRGNRIGVVANSHCTILRMIAARLAGGKGDCALFPSALRWGGIAEIERVVDYLSMRTTEYSVSGVGGVSKRAFGR